jgi:hypothetical protein
VIVSAITGATLGIINLVKGEPRADEAGKTAVAVYETLQQKSNEHGDAINKLSALIGKVRLQLTYTEGFKMGYKEHKAEARVLELEQLIAELQGKKKRRRPAGVGGGVTATAPALAPVCKKGFVLDGSRCRRVPKAVAKAVDKVKDEVLKAKYQAELERLKRKKMEQHIQRPAPAPKPMLPLPRKLHQNGKGPKRPAWGD